jgi:SLOG family YspA-like protein
VTAPYRILVTGSRAWDAEGTLRQALIAARMAVVPEDDDLIVVHGACPAGADAMADTWAKDYGFQAERHPADWSAGKGAGFIRNAEMVALGADVCVAFYKQGAGNKGTDHCATLAGKAGIPVRRVTA